MAADGSLRPLIVIDVGHGYFKGHYGPYESGAVATDAAGKKIHEYTLNLAVAKELKTALEAEGFAVILTQNGDRKPLANRFQARLDMGRDCANKVMHLVIHHNAPAKGISRASGLAAFYHEDAGAKSESAEWAARIERKFPERLSKTDGPTTRSSLINYGTYTSENYRDWDVTQGLGDMPAVLVEVGYMSDAADLAYITDRSNQRDSALRIARATAEQYDVMFADKQVKYARIESQRRAAAERLAPSPEMRALLDFTMPKITFTLEAPPVAPAGVFEIGALQVPYLPMPTRTAQLEAANSSR